MEGRIWIGKNLNEEPIPAINSDTEEVATKEASPASRKKPRLRLNLNRKSVESNSLEPRIPKKRKKVEEPEDSDTGKDLSDGEIVETPDDHKNKRQRNESEHSSNDTNTKQYGSYEGVGSAHMSIDALKKERSALNGTFQASRSYFLKLGTWEFPQDIPQEMFKEVVKSTIEEMGR